MGITLIHKQTTTLRWWLSAILSLDMLCFSTRPNTYVLFELVHFIFIAIFLCIIFMSQSWLLDVHKLGNRLWILIQSILQLVYGFWLSWWSFKSQSQVIIDNNLIMVSSQLQESINIRKLVLVNNSVLKQVDMVHSLGKIAKSPTCQTNILWCLQLVIQLKQSCKLVIVRRAFSNIMSPFEVLQQLFDLLNLSLSIVIIFLILLFLSIIVINSTSISIKYRSITTTLIFKVSFIFAPPLLFLPLFF